MSADSPIVFVVDDDTSVRRGVERLLRASGLATETFGSAAEFLARQDHDVLGCIVLDLAMPGLDGLALQDALAARGSILPIVFLSAHGDVPTTVRAMKRGAVDFLTKPVSKEDLLRAIAQSIERCALLRQTRRDVAEVERRLASLTPREREVLRHLLSGKMNKQVAADLGTVVQTIKVHRGRIMQKMQVRSIAELVRIAGSTDINATPPAEG